MSKILCVDYGLCNFHNLISLVEDGHKVYVLTSEKYELCPTTFYKELGIQIVDIDRQSVLDNFIESESIDVMISTDPTIDMINTYQHKLKYIGLTPRSSRLETHKWMTRCEVKKLGIKVPEILSKPTAPCVIKPIVTQKGFDRVNICLTEESLRNFDNDSFYVEEYLTDTIETNVDYIMSHGKWSILHTQQKIGEDLGKMSNRLIHWTCTSSFRKLSKDDNDLVLDNAKKYLDWASAQCSRSSYIGQLTGFIKDGEWYFCENNVRPSQTNSVPYFVSGDEWLMAMSGHPEIIGESFPVDVNKMIVMPREPDSPYPFDLHLKHNVAIPCGLDIIDDAYRVSLMMRGKSTDNRIGLLICDENIPQGFVDDIRIDGNFLVTAFI